MKELNLNHHCLNLENYPFGKTNSIQVKIGRNSYLIDIEKDSHSTFLCLYKKISKDRSSYSKYDPACNLTSVLVRNDAILFRDFFESIEDISKAQDVYRRFGEAII